MESALGENGGENGVSDYFVVIDLVVGKKWFSTPDYGPGYDEHWHCLGAV